MLLLLFSQGLWNNRNWWTCFTIYTAVQWFVCIWLQHRWFGGTSHLLLRPNSVPASNKSISLKAVQTFGSLQIPNIFGWKPQWFLSWDIWLDIVVQALWQIFFASLSCILWESWEHLGRRSSLFDSGTQRIPTYTRVKERCCSQSKEFQRTTSTLNAQKSDFCNGLGLELLILFFWNFYPIATIRVPSIVGLPPRLTSFWIISSQNSSNFEKFPLKFFTSS